MTVKYEHLALLIAGFVICILMLQHIPGMAVAFGIVPPIQVNVPRAPGLPKVPGLPSLPKAPSLPNIGGATLTGNLFVGDCGQPAPSNSEIQSKICSKPQGLWIVDDSSQGHVLGEIDNTGGKIPVVVFYRIMDRDCGGASSGGVHDLSQYKSAVDAVAGHLHNAIVILEPDALPFMAHNHCDDSGDRYSALCYAIEKFGPKTYVDAGGDNWASQGEIKNGFDRIKHSGNCPNFGAAVNVSGYETEGASKGWAEGLGVHFIVDTSRSGKGRPPGCHDNGCWCDPPHMQVGPDPQLNMGGNYDARLWVKRPRELDGCRGGAGKIDDGRALELIHGT